MILINFEQSQEQSKSAPPVSSKYPCRMLFSKKRGVSHKKISGFRFFSGKKYVDPFWISLKRYRKMNVQWKSSMVRYIPRKSLDFRHLCFLPLGEFRQKTHNLRAKNSKAKNILKLSRKPINCKPHIHNTLCLCTLYFPYKWFVKVRIIKLYWSSLGQNRYGTNWWYSSI